MNHLQYLSILFFAGLKSAGYSRDLTLGHLGRCEVWWATDALLVWCCPNEEEASQV